MDICTECGSAEQGFHEDPETGSEVCNVCEMEDTKKCYDEDAGRDR